MNKCLCATILCIVFYCHAAEKPTIGTTRKISLGDTGDSGTMRSVSVPTHRKLSPSIRRVSSGSYSPEFLKSENLRQDGNQLIPGFQEQPTQKK